MCDDYDYEEDPYDYCYECSGYGDDYYMNEDGELVCRCPECLMNSNYDYRNSNHKRYRISGMDYDDSFSSFNPYSMKNLFQRRI